MAEPLTLYKLIVLYMMKKVDFPLTNAQISEFILDKGYTTYFKLQQAISELIDSEFVEEETIQKIEVERCWTWEDEKLMEAYTCKKNMDEFRKGRM